MRSILVFALLLLAPCLWADFSAEITGAIKDPYREVTFAGVKVTLAHDPMRGAFDYRLLESLKKKYGPLAEISISGSAVTDADGNFKMTATFKKEGEGKFLRTSARRANNARVVHVFVNIEKEGYLKNVAKAAIIEGRATKLPNIYPRKIPEVKGSLFYLSDRKPAAGVKVRLSNLIQSGLSLPGREVTVTTDADGAFRFHDPYSPWGNVTLSLIDKKLAFGLNSTGRKPFSTSDKPVDLGKLTVVPGGGIKFRCIDSETSKLVAVTAELRSGYQKIASKFALKGEFEFTGLPEGEYTLNLRPGSYTPPPDRQVTISAGEVLDIGNIEFQPLVVQQFNVTAEDGGNVQGSITAELIGDRKDVEPTQRNGQRINGDMQGSFASLPGVYRGRWFVVFKANNYAPAWMKIDLPAPETPSVVLQKGGKLELTAADGKGNMGWVCLTIADSPAAKIIEKHQRQHQPKFDNNMLNQPAGLLENKLYAGQKYNSGPLATGKYLVAGFSNATGLFRQEVDVVNGQTATIDVRPRKAHLRISVTDNGQPAPGTKLYYHRKSDYGIRRNKVEVQELKCDASGRVELTAEATIAGYILLKREHDWVSGTPEYQREECFNALGMRYIELVQGATADITIESAGGEFCFLRIEAKRPKGAVLNNGTLVPHIQTVTSLNRNPNYISSDSFNPTSKAVDGALTFGMLRPGRYVLHSQIGVPGGFTSLVREIVVEPKGEQELKLDVKLNKLTVKLKSPRGVDADRMSVSITPANPALGIPGFIASATRDKKDFVFEYVPSGEYCIAATASSRERTYKAYETVNVSRSTKAKISFESKQGGIGLDLMFQHGKQMPQYMAERFLVSVFDQKGKRVDTIDPREAYGWRGMGMVIDGLEPGKYTVKVRAHGKREWVKEDIKVEDGAVTRVRGKLEDTPVAHVALKDVKTANLGSIELGYTDASGNELKPDAPDDRNMLVDISGKKEPTLYICNLPSGIKKLTIKIKGYQAVVLDIDAAGKNLSFSPSFQKE